LPPYKESGNNWQHTPKFQYKRARKLYFLVITVAGKNTLATKSRIDNGWRPRNTGLLPPLPVLPVFFESQEHVLIKKPGQVTL
jgi:hypothetical protein